MPNGDYGIFTPTEAAYKGPGDFDKAIRAEAQKRGAYLSSMDQFYAQLEVMEKQFGEKLAFEEKRLGSEEQKWEEELSWLKEQETGRLGLEREKLTTQRTLGRYGVEAAEAGRAPESGITLDWLSQQIERMDSTSGAKTTSTMSSEEAYKQYYTASDRYQAALGGGEATSYSTPGELSEDIYQTEGGTWRNF